MSAFHDAIDAALDAGTEIMCRRLFDFDFAGEGNRIRLWEGNGKLFAGGQEWIGTIIDDQNYLDVPELTDGRDGSDPLLTFRLGFLPEDTYRALRLDRALSRERPLTIWRCYFEANEGMRPLTALGHPIYLVMKDAGFEERQELTPDGLTRLRVASVQARAGNAGRSYAPNDTLNDTNQRVRAMELAGVEGDAYAQYTGVQLNRRLVIN